MKIMKQIITLLLVLFFASCEQTTDLPQRKTQQKDFIKIDPDFFQFTGSFETDQSKFSDLTLERFKITCSATLNFTISDDDNCTYFIYSESWDYSDLENRFQKIFDKRPTTALIKLYDKHQNAIYSFDPRIRSNEKIDGTKKTYKGKILNLKYSEKLTRSKLQRTKKFGMSYEYRLQK